MLFIPMVDEIPHLEEAVYPCLEGIFGRFDGDAPETVGLLARDNIVALGHLDILPVLLQQYPFLRAKGIYILRQGYPTGQQQANGNKY
jgi:hypothetical protein